MGPIGTNILAGPQSALSPECQSCSYITNRVNHAKVPDNVCLKDNVASWNLPSRCELENGSCQRSRWPNVTRRTGSRIAGETFQGQTSEEVETAPWREDRGIRPYTGRVVDQPVHPLGHHREST